MDETLPKIDVLKVVRVEVEKGGTQPLNLATSLVLGNMLLYYWNSYHKLVMQYITSLEVKFRGIYRILLLRNLHIKGQSSFTMFMFLKFAQHYYPKFGV